MPKAEREAFGLSEVLRWQKERKLYSIVRNVAMNLPSGWDSVPSAMSGTLL